MSYVPEQIRTESYETAETKHLNEISKFKGELLIPSTNLSIINSNLMTYNFSSSIEILQLS